MNVKSKFKDHIGETEYSIRTSRSRICGCIMILLSFGAACWRSAHPPDFHTSNRRWILAVTSSCLPSMCGTFADISLTKLDPSLTLYPTRVSRYRNRSSAVRGRASLLNSPASCTSPCFTSEQRQVSNFLRIEHFAPAGIPLLCVFSPFPDSLLTSLNVYLICFNACSLEPASTSSLLYTFI